MYGMFENTRKFLFLSEICFGEQNNEKGVKSFFRTTSEIGAPPFNILKQNVIFGRLSLKLATCEK